jgi:hypothetical protein
MFLINRALSRMSLKCYSLRMMLKLMRRQMQDNLLIPYTSNNFYGSLSFIFFDNNNIHLVLLSKHHQIINYSTSICRFRFLDFDLSIPHHQDFHSCISQFVFSRATTRSLAQVNSNLGIIESRSATCCILPQKHCLSVQHLTTSRI